MNSDFGVALSQWLLLRDLPEIRKHPILYHYTSAAGLQGIVSSGTLRASNYLYLNDATEIEYGRKVVAGFLEDELRRHDDDLEQHMLRETISRLDPNTWENEPDPIIRRSAPLDVYLTSFCEEPDRLSQWRAYGSAQGRYCIGFEVKNLDGFGRFWPGRVFYDSAEQERILAETTAVVFGAMRHALRERRMPPELAKLVPSANPEALMTEREVLRDAAFVLQHLLDSVLCRIKHPKYVEEREWRSVVDLADYEQSEVLNFQVVDGTVRPYVDLLRGSQSDPKRLPIREIYVGASRRPAQAKRTVELLLRHFGYQNCEVKVSDVPIVE